MIEENINQTLALQRLTDLTQIAYDLFTRNQHYTSEDVDTYFEVLKDAFGDSEASGFLNACLTTVQKHVINKVPFSKNIWNDAVLETIAIKGGLEGIENMKDPKNR